MCVCAVLCGGGRATNSAVVADREEKKRFLIICCTLCDMRLSIGDEICFGNNVFASQMRFLNTIGDLKARGNRRREKKFGKKEVMIE